MKHNVQVVFSASPDKCHRLHSMGFAGYVSICVQLYCVGFHCLSLHVSAYMAIFRLSPYIPTALLHMIM
jgi:hypothetical protein